MKFRLCECQILAIFVKNFGVTHGMCVFGVFFSLKKCTNAKHSNYKPPSSPKFPMGFCLRIVGLLVIFSLSGRLVWFPPIRVQCQRRSTQLSKHHLCPSCTSVLTHLFIGHLLGNHFFLWNFMTFSCKFSMFGAPESEAWFGQILLVFLPPLPKGGCLPVQAPPPPGSGVDFALKFSLFGELKETSGLKPA